MSDKNKIETEEKLSAESAEKPKAPIKKEKKNKKRKTGKIIKWVIILLVVAAAIVFVYKNDTAYSFVQKHVSFLPDRTVEVKTSDYSAVPVERRTISVTLTGTGTLQPIDSYTITSKVSGEIMSADFEEMDAVEKDQVLYIIDSSDLESSIRDYKDNVDDARDRLDDLLEEYEDLELYSDYSGICDALYVEKGDTIQKGTAVAHIIDRETMLLEVPFFVQDVQNIKVGQTAVVTVNAATDTISGTVTEIGALETVTSVGAKLRTVTVSVNNPGGITSATTAYASIDGIESADQGTFKYNVNETITAEYSGEIEKLNFSEGDRVSEGELILRISSENLDDQKESLEKSLEKSIDSYNDYIEKLEDYTITAPIAGTVVQKNYKVSDNLNTGSSNSNSALAIIYDMSKLNFEMNIDELDLSLIEVGQEVEITSDSFDETYTGYVKKKSIIGSSMNGTTTYPVTIELDGNDVLLPGMNVDATIFIEKVEDVIAVPVDAIMRGDKVRVLKNTSTDAPEDTEDKTENRIPSSEIPQRPEENAQQRPEENIPQRPMGNRNPQDAGNINIGNINEEDFEIVDVVTGVSDDEYVEIVSGLSDGDVVIIEKSIVEGNATTVSGGMMGGFGGGMPSGNMGGMPSGNMGGGMPGGMR